MDWRTPLQKNVVSVKHSGLGEQMKINFRITFTNLPCTAIMFDRVDKTGESHSNDITVRKEPFKGDFDKIRAAAINYNLLGPDQEARIWQNTRQNLLVPKWGVCESCHAASTTKISKRIIPKSDPSLPPEIIEEKVEDCCNSCFDLMNAYAKRGIDPEKAREMPQCQGEPEGCITTGVMDVNLVAGNFHILLGETHEGHGSHHHHWEKKH